jgi:hypothetical protein
MITVVDTQKHVSCRLYCAGIFMNYFCSQFRSCSFSGFLVQGFATIQVHLQYYYNYLCKTYFARKSIIIGKLQHTHWVLRFTF